jgi:hypothetical protein
LIQGLRSGNSYSVHGDLINGLDFSAKNSSKTAVMGQKLTIPKGDKVELMIRFKSPKVNNSGKQVKLDHIDLISGDVTGMAKPGTPEYGKDANESTKVIATFNSKQWKEEKDGWYSVTYTINSLTNNKYFRLRGTNIPAGTKNQTDAMGNPLMDDLVGENNADKAYEDLWFYSNPIFVSIE